MSDAPAQSRWYRLTPGRLLPVLLAVEGFLFLAERCHWMSKGWPVVTAIGAVGLLLLLMFLWFLAALVFRLRFQFSILSLLVLMLVVAITSGWLATEMKAERKQREITDGIRKLRAGVYYDYPDAPATPHAPAWLRKLLGDDFFGSVTQVVVGNEKVNDTSLEAFEELHQLQAICLPFTKVTDAGLKYFKGLTQLHTLLLNGTRVGDAGLEHLKGLTRLEWLDLAGTAVSDAGLEHLRGLTQLQELYLSGTRVSDAGLEHFKGLTQLQVLDLRFTKVSDAGVRKLQQALPKCQIE